MDPASADIEIVNLLFIAIGLVLIMAVAIILFFYFSRRKVIQSQLEKANLEIAYQKDLMTANIVTQEAERKRIAQDLHDAISSKLNIVSLNANMLTQNEIDIADRQKIADSILNVTHRVLENSRQIAHDLLPPTLEKFGLKAALEELCEEVLATNKFQISYEFSITEGALSKEQELHLFRIAQELFNNAIKYSKASNVVLGVETTQNMVTLQYKDDGVGFDLQSGRLKKGLGLSGIENRVLILDGKLDFESKNNGGVRVRITHETD